MSERTYALPRATADQIAAIWESMSECLDATDDDDRSAIFMEARGDDTQALRVAIAGERYQEKLRAVYLKARGHD